MFVPKRIIFSKNSLNYDMGKMIYDKFKDNPKVEIITDNTHNIKKYVTNTDMYSQFKESKKTLVAKIKTKSEFLTCKPSADFQLPLTTGCIGHCEYCYLNTKLGDMPVVKVNVNIDDILNKALEYIEKRNPNITTFEGSATSDPLPIEPYTNCLKKTIEFFGSTPYGRFRFVTKFNNIDSLIKLKHNGHTEIRFSLNTDDIIKKYEHHTPSSDKRIDASIKLIEDNYPIGYIIAPVFIYDNWKEDYHNLLLKLSNKLPKDLKYPISFEIISHRYTVTAKNRINIVFPDTKLPMDNSSREFKYGQFGYGKYVYKKTDIQEIKTFFSSEIEALFNNYTIKYII